MADAAVVEILAPFRRQQHVATLSAGDDGPGSIEGVCVLGSEFHDGSWLSLSLPARRPMPHGHDRTMTMHNESCEAAALTYSLNKKVNARECDRLERNHVAVRVTMLLPADLPRLSKAFAPQQHASVKE